MSGHGHDHEDDHQHHHEHAHGHSHDQGVKGMLRYLRHAPQMWSSGVNTAVVERLSPTSGETAMDIGAGIGAGTVVAAKRGCNVLAIEPTPYMRQTLGLRIRAMRMTDNVRIIDGTAEATTVAPSSVDAAWAVNTMHHWSNLGDGVAELARVLAPGGRTLLVDEQFGDPAHPDYERFNKSFSEHEHQFHVVDPEVVGAAMADAGLTVAFASNDVIAGRPAVVVEATKPAD